MNNFVQQFKQNIFDIDDSNFDEKALEIFEYQASKNEVYKQYLAYLKIEPSQITQIVDIPFLPIEFFKTHKVISGNVIPKVVFESSGTTGRSTSKHYVADLEFYNKICAHTFTASYGELTDYTFFALLPSYSERNNSSLVYMVSHFISQSSDSTSGFYLYNYEEMAKLIRLKLRNQNESKIILFGVTFALLELALNFGTALSGINIIETGGMKGRGKEMVREEVHQILIQNLSVNCVGSEYGMTEMLSQAYAKTDGIYSPPNWLKIVLRNTSDPFEKGQQIVRGGINIIDLANIDSCAFIETKDLGQKNTGNSFEILGRFDNSDLRGCNLLVV